MTTPPIYKLEIHIDSQQITKESLEEKANHVLQKYLEENSISLEINTLHDFYYQLVVNGDLQSVDACHHKIDEDIIKKEDLKFYRCTDEAGDEIRYLVYPILADIEQRFRAFINKALAEILGFDWWVNSVPEKINKVTNDRYSNSRKDQIAPHYLECTLFDDLIKLITINYCEFQDNLSFTNKEFDQLLQDCHSFDDLKLKWNQKKKVLSYWEIFSKYFNDRQQWDDFKKKLEGVVIKVRNKVMHHRPVRFYLIQQLEDIKKELIKVFDSAKPELSEEERIEAKRDMIGIGKLASKLDSSNDPFGIRESTSKLDLSNDSLGIRESTSKLDLSNDSLGIRESAFKLDLSNDSLGIRESAFKLDLSNDSLGIRESAFKLDSSNDYSSTSAYSNVKELFEKSIIETEEFFEDEIDSDLLNEKIEENNEFHDTNSDEDNIIADENELDQDS